MVDCVSNGREFKWLEGTVGSWSVLGAFCISKYLLVRHWTLLPPLACDWKPWIPKMQNHSKIVPGLKCRDLGLYNCYEHDCCRLHSVTELVYWQVMTREEEEIHPTFICSRPNLQAPISLRKRRRKREGEKTNTVMMKNKWPNWPDFNLPSNYDNFD